MGTSEVKTEKVLQGEPRAWPGRVRSVKANPDHVTPPRASVSLKALLILLLASFAWPRSPPFSFIHVANRSSSLPQIEHIGSPNSTSDSQISIATQTAPFGSRRSLMVGLVLGAHRRFRKGLYCKWVVFVRFLISVCI